MKTYPVQGTPRRRRRRLHAALALLAFLPACSPVEEANKALFGPGTAAGQPGYVTGFLGGVAADEPRAVVAGREVLSAGGTAGDAAVAVALTLAVTLPSRAGLGGGGACIAYSPDRRALGGGVPEAVLFAPAAPAASGIRNDRPAAVPMLARGLYLLHARYGSRPFESLVASAEQLARFGVPASRALVKDIGLVAGPLLADPGARAVFSVNGVPLTEGQTLRQPDLGGTLAQIRVAGVGDMYVGSLGRRVERSSVLVGGPITAADLRAALPKVAPPLVRNFQNDRVAFLPPPVDGGIAAAAAFDVLASHPDDTAAAESKSLAAAARFREGGITAQAVLATNDLTAPAPTIFPASTSFVTMDRSGNAVACALTMDNLFGTGRILPDLGFLAAASPSAVPAPLLAAGVIWNENLHAFRAAAAGSGQAGAPLAVASALINTLRTSQPLSVPVPDPGRVNIIACSRYLPGESRSCGWANDPREAGLAMGAN